MAFVQNFQGRRYQIPDGPAAEVLEVPGGVAQAPKVVIGQAVDDSSHRLPQDTEDHRTFGHSGEFVHRERWIGQMFKQFTGDE